MRIAYLFPERDVPLLSSRGSCVHVREMCDALSALGHEVSVFAGVAGDVSRRTSGWRLHELTPGASAVPRRGAGNGHVEELGQPSWSVSALAADAARIPWWRAWSALFSRRARPFLERERPDLIYERYVLGSRAGVCLSRRLRVPLIVEMNASYTFPAEWWEAHTPVYPLTVRRQERALARRADHVVVVSTRLREHLLRLGVPGDKVSVLFNGVDAERFRPDPVAAARVRARYGLEPRHRVVGFVGSLRRWHGVELLLAAVRRLAAEAPELRVLVVGDGPLRPALEAAAAERVVFTGSVPRQEVPAHIAAMDIAAAPYPRLCDFHFSPLKLFEYMAVGRPVVASRYPDIAAVIEDERSGLLVEPGEVDELAAALLRLVRDPSLAARLGEEARRRAAGEHSWRRNAEAVVEQARRALAS